MIAKDSKANVVLKVMRSLTTPQMIGKDGQKPESKADCKTQQLLILNRMVGACKKFESEREEQLAKNNNVMPETWMIQCFKYQFASYLSCKMFNFIKESLEGYSPLRT